MIGTETHLSDWLCCELGEWGWIGMLVSSLGFGLRASSLPASVMGKAQILQVSALKLQDPLSSVGNSAEHPKRVTKDYPWDSGLQQTPLSSLHLPRHIMGLNQLWLLHLSHRNSPQGYKWCLTLASQYPAPSIRHGQQGWTVGSQSPQGINKLSPGSVWCLFELHAMLFIWN